MRVLYGLRVPAFPYRLISSNAVDALVATVRADPDFVAGCLVCVRAHGYSIELEYMQRRDGTMRYRTWDDVQAIISMEERTIVLDIVDELARVREHGLDNRTLPDVPGSGRRTLVVFANSEGGCWVDAPAPGVQPRGDSPIDRVFNVVFPR